MRTFEQRHRARRTGPGTGLARALSKLGYCSRSQARELAIAGQVEVNGAVQRNPERRVALGQDRITVDGQLIGTAAKVYLMLNKPRGLVTTTEDEQGRPTVYRCLEDAGLPFVAPVGRLDQASEGLILFTNDTEWASQLTAPESHVDKTYHVQVDCVANAALAQRLTSGLEVEGDFLAAKRATVLRHGIRNSWLEVVLDEGKNRHIRRLLGALGVNVLRLVRVALGPLALGNLAKGKFRLLSDEEVRRCRPEKGLQRR